MILIRKRSQHVTAYIISQRKKFRAKALYANFVKKISENALVFNKLSYREQDVQPESVTNTYRSLLLKKFSPV